MMGTSAIVRCNNDGAQILGAVEVAGQNRRGRPAALGTDGNAGR